MEGNAEIWFDWVHGLLKGLRRIMVFFESPELQVFEWTPSESRKIHTQSTEMYSKVSLFLKSIKTSEWFIEDELPFHTSSNVEGTRQLSLHRESFRNILALRAKNGEDSFVLLIYLESPGQHFGPAIADDKFTLSNKKLIEQFLLRSMSQHVRHLLEKEAILEKFASYQSYLRESNIKFREMARIAEINQKHNVEAYIRNTLADIGEKSGLLLEINKEGIDFLINKKIAPPDLKKLLTEISQMLKLSADFNKKSLIDVVDLEWALANVNLPVAGNPISVSENQVTGRLSKTRVLLDRYEEAARLAIYNDEMINGKNIAKHCDPPVTNASISDALKKHKDRLIELLKQDKESWPLLRTKFKSVYLLSEKESVQEHIA